MGLLICGDQLCPRCCLRQVNHPSRIFLNDLVSLRIAQYRRGQDIVMNGDESILTVSRSRSSVPGQGVIEGTTKNGQARIIYLSEDMTPLRQPV